MDGHADYKQQSTEPEDNGSVPALPVLYERVVFVLIDALRADFVLPNVGSAELPRMKFLSQMVESGKTYSYLSRAHPPTVTMPRIKALMSGGIPGFVDVVFNFDSSSLSDDNLIWQLSKQGHRLVFYGDDTWLRLFPGHFIRSEGTTSFFVSDYTEVDNNVTRHLDTELVSEDWQGMFLHYLGLDHIGHLAGPSSTLVPGKLQEMDDIIKRIYESLLHQQQTQGIHSLLVVCGDHGMSEQGSHGGASPAETLTPIIILNTHKTGSHFSPEQEILQIDLTSTLSLLMGVPIPLGNLGVLLDGVLDSLPPRQRLQAAHVNSQQIKKLFLELVDSGMRHTSYHQLERAVSAHTSWLNRNRNNTRKSGVDESHLADAILQQYRQVMSAMRQHIADSTTNYDLHAMIHAIILIWLVLLCVLCSLLSTTIFPSYEHRYRAGVDISVYGYYVFGVSVAGLSWIYTYLCTESTASQSGVLCGAGLLSQVVAGCITMLLAVWITLCVTFIVITIRDKALKQNINRAGLFFSGIFVIHSLSLLSSSFVEEEHQTWLFVSASTQLLMAALLLRYAVTADMKHKYGMHSPVKSEDNEFIRRRLNRSCLLKTEDDEVYRLVKLKEAMRNANSNNGKHSNNIVREPNQYWGSLLCCVIVLAVNRVLRAWNSTGDKWIHLPDVADWINRPENKNVLSVCAGISLCSSMGFRFIITQKRHPIDLVWSFLVLFGVYRYRAAIGSVYLAETHFGPASSKLFGPASSKGIDEARLVYMLLLLRLLHVIYTAIKRKVCRVNTSSQNMFEGLQYCWLVLWLLLLRPHNLPLAVLTMLQQYCMSRVCTRLCLPTALTTAIYICMGNSTYFLQGNSNSLSSIDISAGYVGVGSYQPVLIGMLMAVNTYAGPIYWHVSLLAHLASNTQSHRLSSCILEVCHVAVLVRCLPLAVYTVLVVIQRYHLFVWTVFSPKLLYEGMSCLVTAVIVTMSLILRLLLPKQGENMQT